MQMKAPYHNTPNSKPLEETIFLNLLTGQASCIFTKCSKRILIAFCISESLSIWWGDPRMAQRMICINRSCGQWSMGPSMSVKSPTKSRCASSASMNMQAIIGENKGIWLNGKLTGELVKQLLVGLAGIVIPIPTSWRRYHYSQVNTQLSTLCTNRTNSKIGPENLACLRNIMLFKYQRQGGKKITHCQTAVLWSQKNVTETRPYGWW